jgi:hypothetical protein
LVVGDASRGVRRDNIAADNLLGFAHGRRFATILADPPWRFTNKTGKVAPEHRRLSRYGTMKLEEIIALPVEQLAASTAHLYLWCPNALLAEGLAVLNGWGFTYKSNIVWHKVRKDGGSDGRGVGLFSQRDRANPVWCSRQKRSDARPWPTSSQPSRDSQTRALAQARRAIQNHRVMQSGTVPRTICARRAPTLGYMG